MKKRLISMFMALSMVISMQAPAFAEGSYTEAVTEAETEVVTETEETEAVETEEIAVTDEDVIETAASEVETKKEFSAKPVKGQSADDINAGIILPMAADGNYTLDIEDTQSITKEGENSVTYKLESSYTDVVTVQPSSVTTAKNGKNAGIVTFTVTAVGPGDATVTVKRQDNGTVLATYDFHVNTPAPQSEGSKTVSVPVNAGETEINFVPDHSGNYAATDVITWVISDATVVTISDTTTGTTTNTITPVAEGTTTITAKWNHNKRPYFYTFNVEVTAPVTPPAEVVGTRYLPVTMFDYHAARAGVYADDAVTRVPAMTGATYVTSGMLSNVKVGWESMQIDRCGGCGGANSIGIIPDKSVSSHVVTYEKGIGAHAIADAILAVPSGMKYFSAVAAANHCQYGHPNSMIFTVTINGGDHNGEQYTYRAGFADNYESTAVPFCIDVTGATSLRLQVGDDGNNGNDHSVWADAKFTTEYVDQSARMGQMASVITPARRGINELTKALNDNDNNNLYFIPSGISDVNQNVWTGSKKTYPGIAQNELVGSNIAFNFTEPGIFTLEPNEAKDVFTNVSFPFQLDTDGYYTFDSHTMDASFTDGIGKDDVKLDFYTNGSADYSEVVQTGSSKKGFFPFNDTKGNKNYTGALNYWFGMSLALNFTVLNGGYLDEEKTKPIVFEFSGDDDVWIYIDGKLVMDLGGIHDESDGTINFATGNVRVKNGTDENGYSNTSLDTLLGSGWREGEHTLQLFYLERGKGGSNLKMKFNLPQKDQLVVEKAFDNTSATGAALEELMSQNFTFTVTRDGAPYAGKEYALYENGVLLNKTQATDSNGSLVLKYNQRAVFSLELPRPNTYSYQVVESMNNADAYDTSWTVNKNADSLGNGTGLTASAITVTPKPKYDSEHVDVYAYTFHNVRPNALVDDMVVIDYGKEIDVDVLKNDKIFTNSAFNLSGATNVNGNFSMKGDKVAFVPDKFMDQIETVNYSLKEDVNASATVTVIPATTVYYEDDFPAISFTGAWDVLYSDSSSRGQVQDDGTVGAGNNYGYDSSYEGDLYYSAGSVHVINGSGTGTKASFTFKGTGFDIISRTDNVTGAIRVTAKNLTTGKQVFAQIVDTVYRTGDEVLYQIPVIHKDGLDYDSYEVTITVAKNVLVGTEYEERNTFYLDAIRVYNPLGDKNAVANAAYEADKELNPVEKEIRDMIINQGSFSSVGDFPYEGCVYIDLMDKRDLGEIGSVTDLAEYIAEGPNNEVYLKYSDAIVTTLTTADGTAPDSVQIGAKAPFGTAYMWVKVITDADVLDDETQDVVANPERLIEINTATDMYYDITDMFKNANWSKGVSIAIVGDESADADWYDPDYAEPTGILALTNLKSTGKEVNTLVAPVTLSVANVMATQFRHAENQEDVKDDTLTIYSASTDAASYGKNKNVVFTVNTSSDISSLVIKSGYAVQKQVKVVKTMNEDGTLTFKVTVRAANKSGNYTYQVTAMDGAGNASEATELSIKVK